VVVFLSVFIAVSLTFGAKVLDVKMRFAIGALVVGMMVIGIVNTMVKR